jgi:glycosyltransferase involved in cell wall biosynthesis
MILPAHDEEATVADVVRRAPPFVLGHPVEVVVVDDGSTDRTAEAAAAAGATVHSLGDNRGLGAAVREGLAWAVERGAAATAFLDADGEYAPEELAALVAPILEGRVDYVVGSRFAGLPRAMRPHRWLGNRALTLAMKLLVRRWGVRGLTDGQSGYRALSPRAAADAEILHDFNYAQVLTLDLVAKGFRYAEVPVRYRFRQHGRSFVRLGPYLRRVVPAVWRELRSAPSAMAAPGATARTAPVPPRPMAAPVTLVAETSPSAR